MTIIDLCDDDKLIDVLITIGKRTLSNPKKIALPINPDVPNRIALLSCHVVYKMLPLADAMGATRNGVLIVMCLPSSKRNEEVLRCRMT